MRRSSRAAAQAFRSALSRWVVSPLQGMTFRRFRRILEDDRIVIHPEYWPRAAVTGLGSLVNSVQARAETRRFAGRVDATPVHAPLFVLGHYRGGTTHLHNLLALDPRFGFCNYYQANFPLTFLTTERFGSRMGFLAIRKRPYDDVALGLSVPAEDELALCADTLLSPHMGWHFPARAPHYRRYLTLRDATDGERRTWKRSLARFARKLSLRHAGRPLVFKSPCHTARVATILEAFPDARFVHIHRHPLTVFQSTRNMEAKVGPLFQFQRRDLTGLDDFILWRYRRMYEAYLEDRRKIPPGRLVEVSYDRLIRDPLVTLEEIYETLGLPDFGEARPRVERYLATLDGYRTNRYAELEPRLSARILREWAHAFDAFRYPARPAEQSA